MNLEAYKKLIPEGWGVEQYGATYNIVVISTPGSNSEKGYMTIDLRRRIYDLGMGIPHKSYVPRPHDYYRGAGWTKRIFKDAVEHLTKAMGI